MDENDEADPKLDLTLAERRRRRRRGADVVASYQRAVHAAEVQETLEGQLEQALAQECGERRPASYPPLRAALPETERAREAQILARLLADPDAGTHGTDRSRLTSTGAVAAVAVGLSRARGQLMADLAVRTSAALEPAGELGAAAERFARLALRASPQTQRTYRSVYARFTVWLARYSGAPAAPDAFTADALAAYLDARERDASSATVKKERAALNKLARYLHTVGAIDATEILLVAGPRRASGQETMRDALDEHTWRRVKHLARAREAGAASGRASRVAALRDTAIVLLLGECGLRNEELRQLRRDDVFVKRVDGTRPWLRVHGKGAKLREFPLRTETLDALTRWDRSRPRELADDPLLLPRLGRQRVDGGFPEAGGALSGKALTVIVKPIMQAAGVPTELCHPHVLRHTFGSLWMSAGGELSELQKLMGHSSPATTSVYVHHTTAALERAVELQDQGPGPWPGTQPPNYADPDSDC